MNTSSDSLFRVDKDKKQMRKASRFDIDLLFSIPPSKKKLIRNLSMLGSCSTFDPTPNNSRIKAGWSNSLGTPADLIVPLSTT
jgi:hypothetical protein